MDFGNIAVLKGVRRNPLLESQPVSVSILGKDGWVLYLDPRRVRPLPKQPRWESNPGFSQESIRGLARSIQAIGQREAAKVCLCRHDTPEFDAQLFDGERRLRACLSAGLMIRVEVSEERYDDDVLLLLSAASNFGKEVHTTPETASFIGRFREMEMTFQQIADVFGKSVTWVQMHANLLKLDPEVLNLLAVALDSVITIDDEEVMVTEPARAGGRKRRSRGISFSLTPDLIDLPATDQKAIAKYVIQHDLPLTAARRYIVRYRRETSQEKENPRWRPKEWFESLQSLTRRTIEQFGVYEDMKPREFQMRLAMRSAKELQDLARELDGLVVTLKSFSEMISTAKKVHRV